MGAAGPSGSWGAAAIGRGLAAAVAALVAVAVDVVGAVVGAVDELDVASGRRLAAEEAPSGASRTASAAFAGEVGLVAPSWVILDFDMISWCGFGAVADELCGGSRW